MSNIHYAVKIIENYEENIEDILQEYRILFEHSLHPNIPMLHGAYRRVSGGVIFPLLSVMLQGQQTRVVCDGALQPGASLRGRSE